jgi:hypothetical protein
LGYSNWPVIYFINFTHHHRAINNSTPEIAKFKQEMTDRFKMSDLGLLAYYLSMEVTQQNGEITLCQSAYAAKLLEKAGMTGCTTSQVPMEPRLKLSKESSNPPVDVALYRSITGSLCYLVHSRPDIAYAVGYVSHFMERPTMEHLSAVKFLLRYIASTKNFGCVQRSSSEQLELVGYSDSDHAGDQDDRKSSTGSLFFINGCPVTWQSVKQHAVALSSCEAEYMDATAMACQAAWLRRLLGELLNKEEETVKLYIDKQSAIQMIKNPVYNECSKHIDTHFHYIRECIEDGKVAVEHIGTTNQLADILTKPLGRIRFQDLRARIGIIDITKD